MGLYLHVTWDFISLWSPLSMGYFLGPCPRHSIVGSLMGWKSFVRTWLLPLFGLCFENIWDYVWFFLLLWQELGLLVFLRLVRATSYRIKSAFASSYENPASQFLFCSTVLHGLFPFYHHRLLSTLLVALSQIQNSLVHCNCPIRGRHILTAVSHSSGNVCQWSSFITWRTDCEECQFFF